MSHQKEIQEYCRSILSGKIPACRRLKLGVKRFIDDLKKQKEPSCLYEYKPELVDEFLDWAETLKVADIQTDTKQLKLLPWQKWIYAQLIGFVYKHDNNIRRFKKSFILVSRKNGKTTGFLLPLLLDDFLSTDAAESYLISGDGAQASKTYKELLYVVKADPDLRKVISETVTAITYQNSRIAFFSSETANLDSYKPSIALIDEYWNYDTGKPVTSMEYGMRVRKNGQVVIITSAGPRIDGPAYEEYQRACKVLEKQIDNDNYLSVIYQIDEEDDWKDPSVLIKANPSMGEFLRKEVLLKDLDDALQLPSNQPEYKSKTLGVFTYGTTSWIPIQKWERNRDYKYDELDIFGLDCWGALDLSSVNDFTAYTLYFKNADGLYLAKHRFYIPEATIQEKFKKDNINILSWVQSGLVTATTGETVDYDFIFNDIVEDTKRYSIKEIAYDKWHSNQLIDRLEKELYSISYVKYDQSLKSMSPATKQFEKAVLDGQIVDNNPVMKWMVGNVLIKPDVNGNYKPLKENKSSTARIDGVVTSIMSFDRLKQNEQTLDNYTLEDILASI